MNALVALSPEGMDAAVQAPGAAAIDVGLMRLCGRDLAVPAANVREVVPLPGRLHPSFSGNGASIGSIVIRGRVIPVLDIAAELGFGARAGEHGVVLILRHADALVGLVMDLVSGLARVPGNQVQPFAVSGGHGVRIVSSSFPHGDTLVGLIDPAAVFALPGVPHARESAALGETGGFAIRSAVVLITIANANLALDANLVVATVPATMLTPSPVPASKWVGVVRYLDQEVPVVDDLTLFGLSGRAADSSSGAVILLRLDEKRMLGVRIDRVRRILPVNEQSVQPLAEALAGQLPLFAGTVVDHDGRQNLLLDGEALTRSEALRLIGSLSRARQGADGAIRPTSAGATARAEEAGDRQPFLVFRAGSRLRAAPLASVKQIIPLPAARTGVRRDQSASGLQGIASYNGAPLPLLDLGGGEARREAEAQPVVLVVESRGTYNGLIVDKLETVARAIARPRPGMGGGEFIDAKVGDAMKAVTLCDLGEEARRLA
ncbi:chemotaxis protein CheW [Sphingomonas sp.]|uniref:chemotaxis protein CheW n=1 Tax=Sphingomonas sp. TaxID=28214 RepID=UPI001B05F2A5|nr:chemotaxis protein CheW [Sphingomonas sp.]MBO9714156.1 chemotaxis protein CheW [Sphingomonas sp.]